jgi:hypothetical protein
MDTEDRTEENYVMLELRNNTNERTPCGVLNLVCICHAFKLQRYCRTKAEVTAQCGSLTERDGTEQGRNDFTGKCTLNFDTALLNERSAQVLVQSRRGLSGYPRLQALFAQTANTCTTARTCDELKSVNSSSSTTDPFTLFIDVPLKS